VLDELVFKESPKFQMYDVAPTDVFVNCTVGVKILVDNGAVNSATGTGNTLIIAVIVVSFVHPLFDVTVNEIEYCPGLIKQCVGFCKLDPPSVPPKFQFHVLIVPEFTEEASVKFTQSGAQPDKTSAEKLTEGIVNTVTVTVDVAGGEQPSTAVTVYVVVTVGEAVGLPLAGLFKPVAGLQE
jgi:hypothetical protein